MMVVVTGFSSSTELTNDTAEMILRVTLCISRIPSCLLGDCLEGRAICCKRHRSTQLDLISIHASGIRRYYSLAGTALQRLRSRC